MEPSCKIAASLVIAIIIVLNKIKNAVDSHGICPMDSVTAQDKPNISMVAVIAGLVAGGVVVFVLIGILIYRKCHKKVKESSNTGIQLISNSAIQGGDFNCFQGDGHTMIKESVLTPETHPGINDPGTAIYNTTKPSRLSSDAYDIISEYKRPTFDSTYDHLPTNDKDGYGKTHVTKHNRRDANPTYLDMTMCSSGVDKKLNVASYKDTEPDQNNTKNKSPAKSANRVQIRHQ